jgi:uncharacterized phage protein (TIGR01671 family)
MGICKLQSTCGYDCCCMECSENEICKMQCADIDSYEYYGECPEYEREEETMREILFKAKRKDNGEWAEGYYRADPDLHTHFICGWRYAYSKNGIEREPFDEQIIPYTLCQYTGLTDKDGKKIWENDILRGHGNDADLAKVIFGKSNVIDLETLEKVDEVICWHTEVIETDALSKCEPFCLPMPLTDFYIKRSEFEVIGNIFDNPELRGVWSDEKI